MHETVSPPIARSAPGAGPLRASASDSTATPAGGGAPGVPWITIRSRPGRSSAARRSTKPASHTRTRAPDWPRMCCRQRAALRGVHRDLDARRPRDAEPHGDELRDVGHHDRDAIARLDAPAPERPGEAPAPGLELADGHVAAAAPEQRVRAVPLDGRVEHAGQRRGQRFHAPD